MKLLFKQRMFSWFDSYDIYDESGRTVYTVKGELAWGHQLRIYDANGNEMGLVKQRIFTLLPKFEIYLSGQYIGCVNKEFSLFIPKFNIDFKGWRVTGDWLGWEYSILNPLGHTVASISKEVFNWTDTYVLNINDPQDALYVLMLVLAIDAEKCSNNS